MCVCVGGCLCASPCVCVCVPVRVSVCLCVCVVVGMFEWLFGHHEAPVPALSDPSSLSYEAGRVMLMKGVDAPFLNNYWDYVTKGPSAPTLEYADKIRHVPLFSSNDQLLTSACMGKLHFLRSIHPDQVHVDPVDGAVISEGSPVYVVSKVGDVSNYKCASINQGGAVPAVFQVGGGGPGGPEMSSKSGATSTLYQTLGPHYIGRVLSDGSWCMEPSAMETSDTSIHEFGVEPDSIIDITKQIRYVCFCCIYCIVQPLKVAWKIYVMMKLHVSD